MGQRVWILVALCLIIGGFGGAWVLASTGPEAEILKPEPTLPGVPIVDASLGNARVIVRSQGTVEPRTESDLVAQVAGEIVWVSPQLVPGGLIQKDEPLARIDPRDYEVALGRAEAQIDRYEGEVAYAKAMLTRVQALSVESVVSASRLDEILLSERIAASALRDARAARVQAKLQLERTSIRSPYRGRVRNNSVDLGQVVQVGAKVARVYASDFAEVRLPISDADLALIEIPGSSFGEPPEGLGSEVLLAARYAGDRRTWSGRVVRSEAELDPSTRVVHVVARVENPEPNGEQSRRGQIPVGLFVQAEIHGRTVPNAAVVARSSLVYGSDDEASAKVAVCLVNAADAIEFRPVTIAHHDGDQSIVRDGIVAGDRICASLPPSAREGMKVHPFRADAAPTMRTLRE